jgi:hypothetical protein
MTSNVQAGLVQLLVAGALFYAFWVGAFNVLLEAVTAAVRGQEPGDLSEALLAGQRPREAR